MAIRDIFVAGAISALLAVSSVLVPRQAVAEPAIQDTFEPGIYRITPLDPDSRASEKPQTLCLTDAQALLRLRHGNGPACHDQFVQPGPNRTTVSYSCAAAGWGRTELRREIPGLYRIDTQGIAGKQPFALRAEVRRLGNCPSAEASPRRR